jgi:hypothetical protein
VLGASSFTYAQATWTQGLADWISGHVGAFEAIGGAPALLVPDNTKVAVIKACLYDPQINRSYADMAAHYGTAILPARPRRRAARGCWDEGSARRRGAGFLSLFLLLFTDTGLLTDIGRIDTCATASRTPITLAVHLTRVCARRMHW